MKANPDIGWHKMPPGSADSLPPSNAKPSTPSNGVTCQAVSSLLSVSSEMQGNDSPSQPSAPKPFKKRYLASQQSQSTDSPSQSLNVSPEAARACEALLEMARTESRSSSDKRVSPSDTPPLQTLREAVWSKVAGTLLQQEEEKLVVPPKDCPMNLTNQCTIRGQQIIEHIIENILNMPMEGPMDPSSEQITFSLNNNQEPHLTQSNTPPATVEVADSIKASIYESLKNDLLKKSKVSGVSPVSRTTNSVSSPPNTPPAVSPGHATVSPPIALTRRPTLPKSIPSPVRVAPPSPQPTTGQDVLRLLGTGQMPISVGNVGNITITKTPRPPAGVVNPTLQSFSAAPSSPVLSLTRSNSSQPVFSLNSGTGTVPILLSRQTQDCVVISPQHGLVQGLITQPGTGGQMVQLVLSPQHSPVSRPDPGPVSRPDPDPVNLSVPSPNRQSEKRPLSQQDEEDIRRSSRAGRGKRYQEFVEEGRISLSTGRKVSRPHRSGEGGHSESESVTQHDISGEELDHSVNHWKKKMRTASLGENTQSVSKPQDPHSTANLHTATNLDMQSVDQMTKSKSSKSVTAHRSTRQSGPEPAAFDARLNRKIREKF